MASCDLNYDDIKYSIYKIVKNKKNFSKKHGYNPEGIKRDIFEYLKNDILKEGQYNIEPSDYRNIRDSIIDIFEDLDFPYTEDPQEFYRMKNFISTMKGIRSGDITTIETKSEAEVNRIIQAVSEPESYKNINREFLNIAYEDNLQIEREMTQQANVSLFNALFVNSDEEIGKKGLITGNQQVNENIRNYQEKLVNTICKYLSTIKTLDESDKSLINSILAKERKLYPDDKLIDNEVLVAINRLINTQLNPLAIAQSLRKIKENNPVKLDAYNAGVIFKNFDSYLSLVLGKCLQINKSEFGKKTGHDKYQIATDTANLSTTWRVDENINVGDEIDAITQLMVSTRPIYDFNTHQMRSNQYLTFGQYQNILGKLKTYSWTSSVAQNIIFDDNPLSKNRFDIKGLSERTRKILYKERDPNGKKWTLASIIAASRKNPIKYTHIVFELFSNLDFKNSEQGKLLYKDVFTTEELNHIYSIYKGLYEIPTENPQDCNSIKHLIGTTLSDKNYYLYLCQSSDSIFKNEFIQYYEESKGNNKARLQTDATEWNEVQQIRSIINDQNKESSINDYDKEFVIPYNIKGIDLDKNEIQSLTFELPYNSSENIKIKITPTMNGFNYDIKFPEEIKNDKTGEARDSIFESSDKLRLAIDKILGLNVANNSSFYSILRSKQQNALIEMLKLVGRVLLAQNLLHNAKTKLLLGLDIFEKYFGLGKIKYLNNQSQIDLVPTAMSTNQNILRLIARVNLDLRGTTTSTQVKDSQLNGLNLQSLSRLLGAVGCQWELIEGNPEGALLGTEFMKKKGALIENHLTTSEHYSRVTRKNKKATEFTSQELIESNFVYDFLPALFANSDTYDSDFPLACNGHALFLASVNSDKPTIGELLTNLNLEFEVNGEKFKLKDATPEQIKSLIRNDFGIFYTNILKNIYKDLGKLKDSILKSIPSDSSFFNEFKSINFELDYYNNFKLLNALFNKYALNNGQIGIDFRARYGDNIVDFIKDLVSKHNNENPNDLIELIDEVHFREVKVPNLEKGKSEMIKQIQKWFLNKYGENWLTDLKLLFNYNNITLRLQNIKTKEDIYAWVKYISDGTVVGDFYQFLDDYKDPLYDSESNTVKLITLELNKYKISQLHNCETLIAQLHRYTGKADDNNLIFSDMYNNIVSLFINNIPITDELRERQKNLLSKIDFKVDCANEFNQLKHWYQNFCRSALVVQSITGHNFLNDILRYVISYEYVDIDTFYNLKSREVLEDLLRNKFKLNLNYSSRQLTGFDKIKEAMLKDSSFANEWVDLNTKDMYLAKVVIDGETKYIKSETDLIKMFGNLNSRQLYREAFQSFTSVQLNPLIERYNLLSSYITQSWMNSTVGSFINHPDKTNLKNVLKREAALFNAQHKRNVAMTAQMHEFSLNTLTGISEDYNLAVIEDINDIVSILGKSANKIKPYDGATFVNPFDVYLENYSLGGSSAGFDKKQFVHFKNARTGTGGIIKTAGFAVTNDRIRNSPDGWGIIMRKMTNKKWRDENGNVTIYDITKDYLGNNINYGDNYFKHNGKLYCITGITVNRNAEGNIESYTRNICEVSELGKNDNDVNLSEEELANRGIESTMVIDSNYMLWKFFGGENSMELKKTKNNGTLLQPSETSIQRVVLAMNSVGTIKVDPTTGEKYKLDEIESQDELYQPLKHSDIDYLATNGAVKQGAANINRKSKYTDDKELDFQRIKMFQGGIQLDKEHHADNSELSLPTQVVKAASSLGYTYDQGIALHQAIGDTARIGIEELFKAAGDGSNLESIDKMLELTTQLLVENLATGSSENTYGGLIAKSIKQACNGDYAGYALPLSDNQFFSKFISTLNSYINKEAIKLKVNGLLAVLTPSHNLYKLYGDRKYDSFTNPEEELNAMQAEKDADPLYDISVGKTEFANIELQRTYKVTYNEEYKDNQFVPGVQSFIFMGHNVLYSSQGTIPDGYGVKVDGNNIYVDSRTLEKKYTIDPTTNLVTINDDSLGNHSFNSVLDYISFILHKELLRERFPRKGSESSEQYENRLSDETFNHLEEMNQNRVTKLVTVNTTSDLRKLKRDAAQGKILKIAEYVKAGRNLAAYNAKFDAELPDGSRRKFQLWEIDSIDTVQNLQDIENYQGRERAVAVRKFMQDKGYSIFNKYIEDYRKDHNDLLPFGITDLNKVSDLQKLEFIRKIARTLLKRDLELLSPHVESVQDKFKALKFDYKNGKATLEDILKFVKFYTSETTQTYYRTQEEIEAFRKYQSIKDKESSEAKQARLEFEAIRDERYAKIKLLVNNPALQFEEEYDAEFQRAIDDDPEYKKILARRTQWDKATGGPKKFLEIRKKFDLAYESTTPEAYIAEFLLFSGEKIKWSLDKDLKEKGANYGKGIGEQLFGKTGASERLDYSWIINNKTGISLDNFVHKVWESMKGDSLFLNIDDTDVRDIVLDLLKSYPKSKDLFLFILLNYYNWEDYNINQSLEEARYYHEKGAKDARDEWFINKFGVDYNTYMLQHPQMYDISLNSPSDYENFVDQIIEDDLRRQCTVLIDGKNWIVSDRSKIDISAYELILPKKFAQEFNLDEFDDLNTIVNDQEFFVKRLFAQTNTLIDSNNYDVALKNASQQHIYLLDEKHLVNSNGLHPTTDELQTILRKGKTYVINNNGDIQYEIIPGTEVYLDNDGNTILLCPNAKVMNKYVSQLRFATLSLSPKIDEDYAFDLILKFLNNKRLSKFLDKHVIKLRKLVKEIDKETQSETNPQVDIKSVINWLSRTISEPEKPGENATEREIREYQKALEAYHDSALYQAGIRMHTCFLKSLETVVARIPAQSLQSFMPMKIVGFDNPNRNSAYVSTLQILLQGSDYDIDAASVMAYTVDKSGDIPLWSPYADKFTLETLNASMDLPYPTGKKAQLVECDESKLREAVQFMQRFSSIFNITQYQVTKKDKKGNPIKDKDGKPVKESHVSIKLNYDILRTTEGLNRLSEFLKECNKGILLPEKGLWSEYLNKILNISTKANIKSIDVEELLNAVKQIADKHNLYLNDLDSDLRKDILCNYIQHNLSIVSEEPVNLTQGQAPVDDAPQLFKSVTKDSEVNERILNRTQGDFTNLAESIVDNQVGKKGISICAVSIKGFFTLTEYYNKLLNTPGEEEKALKLFDSKRNPLDPEKRELLLANIRAKDLSKITNDDVIRLLVSAQSDEDAVLMLSALLSLSTDNAKELELSKLNANANTLGIYLYALSKGMNYKLISDLMMSESALIISDLTKGNVYDPDTFYGNIINAIRYLSSDPDSKIDSFFKYNREADDYDPEDEYDELYDDEEIGGEYKHSEHLIKFFESLANANADVLSEMGVTLNMYEATSSKYHGIIDYLTKKIGNTKTLIDLIEKLRSNYNLSVPRSSYYTIQYNKMLDFIESYIITRGKCDFQQLSLLHDLAKGANEMRIVGQMAGFNQGFKTDLKGIISLINLIKNALIPIHSSEYESNKLKVIKKVLDAGDLIDLFKFAFNEDYRNECIEKYELNVQHTHNILRMCAEVPDVFAYIQSLAVCEKYLRQSIRFRTILDNAFKISNDTKIPIDNVTRGLNNYIGDLIESEFLMSATLDLVPNIIIPEGMKVYKPNGTLTEEPLSQGLRITLGSSSSNATFKKWMESVVIPYLQTESGYKDNLFIRSLRSITKNNTSSGNEITVKGLPINMIPKTDFEKVLLDQYIDSFDELTKNGIAQYTYTYKDADGNDVKNSIPISDLMILYGIVAHKGKTDTRSLMPIFKNKIQNDPLFKRRREIVIALDLSLDSFPIGSDLLYSYITPLFGGNPNSELFWIKGTYNNTLEVSGKMVSDIRDNFDMFPQTVSDEYLHYPKKQLTIGENDNGEEILITYNADISKSVKDFTKDNITHKEDSTLSEEDNQNNLKNLINSYNVNDRIHIHFNDESLDDIELPLKNYSRYQNGIKVPDENLIIAEVRKLLGLKINEC